MLHNMDEHTKHVVDTVSTVTVVGTLMNWIPAIAGLVTIIWYLIRIFETKTVKDLIAKLKDAK
jgi:hypothetical protein